MDSVSDSENQYSQREASTIKRKPLPKPNGPLFTIPRLKKIKRDLLTDLPLDTHECQQEILAAIRKSFHFPVSSLCHFFNRVQSVHNPELTAKYLDRRRDMKSNGYPDALLADTFAFLPLDSPSMVDRMCRDGVRCGNQQFSGLGVSHMAVHLCKHADILTPMKPKCGDRLLLMVKLLKGKVKSVLCKNVGVQLEPTPNYDCHIAKPNVDQSTQLPPHMLFFSSQLYVYEYGDFQIEDYPRQVLPYAVVYYTIREPQLSIPKNIASLPHTAQVTPMPPHKGMAPSALSTLPSSTCDPGPNNEVWRGRLHVHLMEGGHIFIEVVMLSYFVPLTINLISPIKIHSLYPEHNAQFTFFCGLTNIADKDEIEWRAHYFRSCIMRPRPNNEEHFKALIKHINAKREMPTVRLPHDVFLFLMPDCLLASQLGLVRRDDESPVLHCVIMSKYSTSQSQEKILREKRIVLNNYGSATSWESLFDDSDISDDEDFVEFAKNKRYVRKALPRLFHDQRHIHNKFAAMSLADADINFASCACKKLSSTKAEQQRIRDSDVARVYSAVQSATQSSRSSSCFPSGSRHKPKQKLSKKAKARPSFSPHGSSDSDMEVDPKGFSRANHDQYSLLNSTKTVEEELSEEELTNEQMEDIIFLRKPVSSSVLSKPLPHSASTSHIRTLLKPSTLETATPSVKSSASVNDLKKYNRSPLSTKPKIIPTEPLKPPLEKPIPKPIVIPTEPKLIPSEPVNSVSEVQDNMSNNSETPIPVPVKSDVKPGNSVPKVPKSILKIRTVPVTTLTESIASDSKQQTPSVSPAPPSKQQTPYTPVSPTTPSEQQTPYSPSVSPTPTSKQQIPYSPSVSPTPPSKQQTPYSPSVSPIPPSKQETPYSPSESPTPPSKQQTPYSPSVSPTPPSKQQTPYSPSVSPTPLSKQQTPYSPSASPTPPSKQQTPYSPSVSLTPPTKQHTPVAPTPPTQQHTSSISPTPSSKHTSSVSPTPPVTPLIHEENDLEDVDMRVPHQHSTSLHPVFLAASEPSFLNPLTMPSDQPQAQHPLSPNLSFGSWLAPIDIPLPPLPPPMPLHHSSPFKLPATPPSPPSPPTESPPSPTYSPASPPTDSPASPPSSPPRIEDSESPASPPQSLFSEQFRSSPVAIPISRIQRNASPEFNFVYTDSFVPLKIISKSNSREGIDNANDMNDFLNSGFDSDLDSSYEDER
ncbi:hypothetical protein BsWGS_13868 [Bradybaena similaris]